MSVQYTRGCSGHQGISLSTLGCPVHRRDTMMSVEDIIVVRRDNMSTGGDVQYTGVSKQLNCFPYDLGHINHDNH